MPTLLKTTETEMESKRKREKGSPDPLLTQRTAELWPGPISHLEFTINARGGKKCCTQQCFLCPIEIDQLHIL